MNDRCTSSMLGLLACACGQPPEAPQPESPRAPQIRHEPAQLSGELTMRYFLGAALSGRPDISYEVDHAGQVTYRRHDLDGQGLEDSGQLTSEELVSLRDRLAAASVCELGIPRVVLADAPTITLDVRMGEMDCRVIHYLSELGHQPPWPAGISDTMRWLREITAER